MHVKASWLFLFVCGVQKFSPAETVSGSRDLIRANITICDAATSHVYSFLYDGSGEDENFHTCCSRCSFSSAASLATEGGV